MSIIRDGWVHSTGQLPSSHKGWVAVKEHPDKCPVCPTCDHEHPAARTRLGPSMAWSSVLTGPAMSLTVALICSTLLKPFLQESRRACHSVKPGQGGKVTTLPPSACARGRGDTSTAQWLCCQPHPGPPDVCVIPLSVCVNGTRSGYAPSHSYLL